MSKRPQRCTLSALTTGERNHRSDLRGLTLMCLSWSALFAAALTTSCGDSTVSVAPVAPDAARYQLRFIVEDGTTQGEITSNLFPEAGVTLNTADPWMDLNVDGAVWSLNNATHGQLGQGTCTFPTDVAVSWDIAGTDPVRSFAGEWAGTVTFFRSDGMNFLLKGDRTTGSGSINNAASNWNPSEEFSAPDKSSFKIRLSNIRLKFGGLSSPDGNGFLADLTGAETACVNLTVEAVKVP